MAGPGPIVLATGGTGGHVFPAEALAGELEARGSQSGRTSEKLVIERATVEVE